MKAVRQINTSEKGSVQIWIVTALLVAVIIGGALYVAMNRSGESSTEIAAPEPVVEELIKAEEPETLYEPALEEPEESVLPEPADIGANIPEEPAEVIEPAEEPEVPEKVTLQLDGVPMDIVVSSSSLETRDKLPLKHTCYRDNLSPPVAWENTPDGAVSFVVFMERLDAEDERFTSWALYDIPGDITFLKGGTGKTPDLDNGARHALNDHDVNSYIGPCEPKGKFKYVLRVFALDEVLELTGPVDKDQLISAMNGHILSYGELNFIHYFKF